MVDNCEMGQSNGGKYHAFIWCQYMLAAVQGCFRFYFVFNHGRWFSGTK